MSKSSRGKSGGGVVAAPQRRPLPKILVILGPTASGKTALAIRLAKRFNGEIVSADSRQVYRGMDIGTGKPTARELRAVRHHCIDTVAPNTRFTLADWQKRAVRAIDGILKRKKLPILCGGTGLYLSSIVENYQIPQKKTKPRYEALCLGLSIPRDVLYKKINARVTTMMRAGLEREIRSLSKKYPWSLPAMLGIGYREWRSYFEKKATRQETIEAIQKATRQFSKRQMTWFRRMERNGVPIVWVTNTRSVEKRVRLFVSSQGLRK